MKKLLTIIGARPQFIKASAISRELNEKHSENIQEVVVHTGQHYDPFMSKIFFDQLSLTEPNFHLEISGGSNSFQTAGMLGKLEQVMSEVNPDAVLLYGDTNSTLAGSIAAAQLHIPLIHVEAGLRSNNKTMPEEMNRIVCDHSSTLLFAPTQTAINNLEKEGFDLNIKDNYHRDRPGVFLSGDVMFDNAIFYSEAASRDQDISEKYNIQEGRFILCTVHRPVNADDPDQLRIILQSLSDVHKETGLHVVFPVHPRTRKMISIMEPCIPPSGGVLLISPVSYFDMLWLEKSATLIITDSGGVQKEAFFFRKPCVILRSETEWKELTENGNAQLCEILPIKLVETYISMLKKDDYTWPHYFGNGQASSLICQRINEFLLTC
ncbi:MAG: UDP-N-acetylglucosamine 2-epimerase (non-hydrolyzing) [Flavobacteriales bacterium]|nr:UDP-N-acetylglucosamine 2-epimerase (non-hydrolyzing) [Flavobacteriales bacterium]